LSEVEAASLVLLSRLPLTSSMHSPSTHSGEDLIDRRIESQDLRVVLDASVRFLLLQRTLPSLFRPDRDSAPLNMFAHI
jgi:hypothetical protein